MQSKSKIQTRPIFSGNILKQPMMKNIKTIVSKSGYKNSDYVMNNGLLIGCHSNLTNNDLKYICNSLKKFFVLY